MTRTSPCSAASADRERPLLAWLERYAKGSLSGIVLGTALCLLALFTNPVPDPSFEWFSLPAAYRLPVVQPRIEHWPVSYTAGVWLWILCVPGLFLRGYDRWGGAQRFDADAWLVAFPTTAMLALTTYCRFFWPKLAPPTWNAPSYTLVCWGYCSTYDPFWSNLAYGVALLGAAAAVLAAHESSLSVVAEATFGVLALPLGLPALYDAYCRSGRGESPN